MIGSLFTRTESARAFEHHVHVAGSPVDLVRITGGEHLDLVAVDRKVLTVEDLNLGSETAVGRVVAQQVRVGFEVTESVDRNNLHIIPALFFVEGAENAAADAAKTVNGKTNSHL